MRVSELLDRLDSPQEQTITTILGDIEISDDASTLSIYDQEFSMDQMAENALANYLDISRSYLQKCPAELKATNFRYWLDYKDNAQAVLEVANGALVGVHRPDALLIPTSSVYQIVSRVFDGEDEIRDLRRDDRRLHLDVTTHGHTITVPNPDGLTIRPEVGDVTAGGVRILSSPNEAKAPSVSTFLYRLVCRNGMTTPEHQGTIRLKGHTVPDVLAEMETAAQQVLSGLDDKLRSYAEMAQRPIPGSNATAFVYQIAREANLGQRVVDRLVERANILPAEATLYDVQQLFTEVANSGVSYSTMTKLQTVGGELAFETERVLHRCSTCERILPS